MVVELQIARPVLATMIGRIVQLRFRTACLPALGPLRVPQPAAEGARLGAPSRGRRRNDEGCATHRVSCASW